MPAVITNESPLLPTFLHSIEFKGLCFVSVLSIRGFA